MSDTKTEKTAISKAPDEFNKAAIVVAASPKTTQNPNVRDMSHSIRCTNSRITRDNLIVRLIRELAKYVPKQEHFRPWSSVLTANEQAQSPLRSAAGATTTEEYDWPRVAFAHRRKASG